MRMTSSSLTNLLSSLSREHSTQVTWRRSASSQGKIELRFSDVDQHQSFSLSLIRSWKLTEVVFSADPFASKVVEYLVSRALEIPNELSEIISHNRPSYSECEFKINGLDLADNPGSSENPSFTFRATKFSSESSLEHGLISDSEALLIRFAILFFSTLLPSAMAPYTNPDEVLGFPEGAASQVLVNKYERDPRNRKAAIELHGTKCMACGFDFEATYGSLGRGYIVIHHTTPVSAMGADYVVDPAKDLVAICANCHPMVHREDPPIKLEELRKIILTAHFAFALRTGCPRNTKVQVFILG